MKRQLIYHYTSQSGFLGILTSKQLWASELQFLNDSREYKIAAEKLRKTMESLKFPAHDIRAFVLAEALDYLDQLPNLHVFVASFSGQRDKLSQWRGYSKGEVGYSLGFDLQALRAAATEQGFRLERCIYDKPSQAQAVTALLEDFLKLAQIFRRQTRDEFHISAKSAGYLLERLASAAPLFKDEAFSEEDEWRLVSSPKNFLEAHAKTRCGKHWVIPYVPFMLNSGDTSPLKELIIGPCVYPVLAQQAVLFPLSETGFLHVDCTLSEIPFRAA